ncbi:probable acyl-activating enzyme 17, peroxisomal [Eutrema salsugineum]|uniref:probable acyl-activating enzyme 17, peroxisomal n=1 Tax=Eutrema salsugineum TaxID=72664 RepID=UPI000CECE735|nr:probable acyl-activating enzyme 17, peroxisomal [Eutrema salsugineum]
MRANMLLRAINVMAWTSEDGNPLPPSASGVGELALCPHMFGASSTLLNGNHYKVYFKGMPTFQGQILRRHGDLFERTSKGYYRAHGRADDTMNLQELRVTESRLDPIEKVLQL